VPKILLYLFSKINANEIPKRSRAYDIISINHMNKKYVGVIVNDYSQDKLARTIKDITLHRGFD